ncbi:MAG TPA: polysaccharide deacetylase family protein [Solirubrobacteraceae bacterium]|nr:polysaccharide deacetylase family protein [Solirubrobacteraceae bacterium]
MPGEEPRAPTRPEAERARRRRRKRRAQARRRRLALAVSLAAVAVAIYLLAGGTGDGDRAPRAGAVATAPRVSAQAPRRPDRRAREAAEIRRLIAIGKPIYCAGHRSHELALTFDDGPGPYTHLVLDKLRKHRLSATFFIVGRNIPLVPGITRRERAQGAVGDHTFTHPDLTTLGSSDAEAQIVRTQSALARASGGPVSLFRPPYGAHDATVDAIARSHHLLEILWNVDSADSLGADYAQIERNVIAGLRPGAIILMHENRGQTVRALLAIFAALQRKHLHAVSVPQLLADDPPGPAQIRAGGRGCGIGSRAPGAG